ncbi:hypothetical protein EAS54_16280 [Bradyrhizobium guangzhouense]|nr:hypothetical protein EAS54_16280 [Bradyrhizobium guangzhouense]
MQFASFSGLSSKQLEGTPQPLSVWRRALASRRHRESRIDAELDLSHVVHLATANSVERLPSQLRDRMRVIRIGASASTTDDDQSAVEVASVGR